MDTVVTPLEIYSLLIHNFASEVPEQRYYRLKLKESEHGQIMLELSREEQREVVMAMVAWLDGGWREIPQARGQIVMDLFPLSIQENDPVKNAMRRRWFRVRYGMLQLLRRKLPFNHDEVLALLSWSTNQDFVWDRNAMEMIRVLENYLQENPLTDELKDAIAQYAAEIKPNFWGPRSESRRWVARLKELGELRESDIPLEPGEVWADAVIADIEAMTEPIQGEWKALIQHCATARSSKPSKKWTNSAETLIQKINPGRFKQMVLKWFLLVNKPRTVVIEHNPGWASPDPNYLIDDLNADVLRGLVWVCSLFIEQDQIIDRDLMQTLTALAFSTYKKVPQRGPRCTKVGNACVWVLGNLPGLEGVGQLALLKLKVKAGNVQNSLERAIEATATREGIPTDEIEELSAPTYGMGEVGLRREKFGDFTAELLVSGTTATELRWLRPAGKPQKSVPKVVKENFPKELKELRLAAKEIKKMLPVQRDRIDNLYLNQKEWDYPVWRERYLDHPLVGTLARRIIWEFSDIGHTAAGIWLEGEIVSHDEQRLEFLGDSTKVSLWHPITSPLETILAWRNWLMTHEVQQPFKQAHREIYPLTDAERETRVYSNRYAAHIIRQHQFHALCGVRGWSNQLRLMVDDFYGPACKLLPEWGLRAEFWVEGIGDEYGVDTTDAGTYLYLTTDQVRFYRQDSPGNFAHANGGGYRTGYFGRDSGEPIPLDEIPPLVLTEIMRDVDLFVGVASIGNDPNWLDGGPDVRYQTYWNTYSFGDLSATAKTRKELLAQLIPALKIAPQCELSDKFLVVRGDLRTYKIHLGSGNILMEPNNQYLCIVPARGAAAKRLAGKVFLPFEGDQTLAVILSKAFLLAEDTKITDATITRQIQSKR